MTDSVRLNDFRAQKRKPCAFPILVPLQIAGRQIFRISTNSCTALKNAAAAFVDNFAPGRDKVGLLTFGGSDLVDIAPTVNFTTSPNDIKAKVNSIACNGATGTPQALWHAYQQLTAINESGALNVVLVFTDGLFDTTRTSQTDIWSPADRAWS